MISRPAHGRTSPRLPEISTLMTHYLTRKMDALDIPPIPEFVTTISNTDAGLYACKASCDLFELTDSIPQVRGVITNSTGGHARPDQLHLTESEPRTAHVRGSAPRPEDAHAVLVERLGHGLEERRPTRGAVAAGAAAGIPEAPFWRVREQSEARSPDHRRGPFAFSESDACPSQRKHLRAPDSRQETGPA